MNFSKPIGGYFELELSSRDEYHDTLSLNSARNGFEYILRTKKPNRVYMPKFTCDVMLEPLIKLNVEYVYYELNDQLEILNELAVNADELLVYTNYFGIKNNYSHILSRQFGNKLIVDCSQAFYYAPVADEHVIYSPRKFFGVADGAYVITDETLDGELQRDISYLRMQHLLERIDLGAEAGYADFKVNDDSLKDQPIKEMSLLTKKILASIDYEAAKERRAANFRLLHDNLSIKNKLTIDMSEIDGPMIYPFLIDTDATSVKEKLIAHKIFTPTYWPNVFQWCEESETEYRLARDIIALPIDQRYDAKEMQRILEILL